MDQEQAWSPAEPCSYGGKSTGAWLAAEDARGQDPSDTFQSAFGNAAKIQAGAFETLSSRLDNLERTAAAGGLRDAMQGLCQGVAMLADHAARSLAQAHTQIEALGGTIDLLGGKIASLVEGAEHQEARAHEQFGGLAEHLESAKARMEQIESSLLERLGSVQIQIEDIGKSLDERLNAAQARIEHLEQTALELDQRSIQSRRQSNRSPAPLRAMASKSWRDTKNCSISPGAFPPQKRVSHYPSSARN